MLLPVGEDPEDRVNSVGVMSSPKSSPTSDEASARQQLMYARFQAWALRNYGELGKTKTVTRSKYNRVKAILKGEEPATADNSKLRFWVKAKGFRLGKFAGKDAENTDTELLYIPSKVIICLILLLLQQFSIAPFQDSLLRSAPSQTSVKQCGNDGSILLITCALFVYFSLVHCFTVVWVHGDRKIDTLPCCFTQ